MGSCSNPSSYSYRHGCRCDGCKSIEREYKRESRERIAAGGPSKWDITRQERKEAIVTDCGNASVSTYVNRKCRCDACRFAHTEYQYNRRTRKQAEAMERIQSLIK